MKGKLEKSDHGLMMEFFDRLYDDVVAGDVSSSSFCGGLAHIIAAIDIGNVGEARSWFSEHRRGIEMFKEDRPVLRSKGKLS